MGMSLEGRAAIVTGGGGAIGRAIALKLAGQGVSIAVADLRLDAAEETAHLVSQAGGQAAPIAADVGAPEQVDLMVRETVAAFGRVDIMVSNAGIGDIRSFFDLTPEAWERTLRINLTGPFLCGQAAAREMTKRKWGRIVNIASISGQKAGWGRTAYGTSKAGVIHLTKQMAMELGPLGITANAIGPGPVDTEMTRTGHTPKTREAYIQSIPAGRYGLPEEMAAGVAFLASEEAAYVNGHCLNVDGGYVAAGIKFDD
jgi:NAD(P)-dependent dehydrogenase (short-subunit alcohol dehydrogenase family)